MNASFLAPVVFVVFQIICYIIFNFLYSQKKISCMPQSLVGIWIPLVIACIFSFYMITYNIQVYTEIVILEGISSPALILIYIFIICLITGLEGPKIPGCANFSLF